MTLSRLQPIFASALAVTMLLGCVRAGPPEPDTEAPEQIPDVSEGVDAPGLVDLISWPAPDGGAQALAAPVTCPPTGTKPAAPPTGPACTKTSACKDYPLTKYCAVGPGVCVECLTDLHCAGKSATSCVDFRCQNVTCKPQERRCQSGFVATCGAKGDVWHLSACPQDKPACLDGQCLPCAPGALFCGPPAGQGAPSQQVLQCACDGLSSQPVWQCLGAWACVGESCGLCVPGTRQCQGNTAMACAEGGAGWQVAEDCTAQGLLCLAGSCVEGCNVDFKRNTNAGCDYWAVDLDNIVESAGQEVHDAQNAQFAVIISNTTDQPAGVVVSLDAPPSKKVSYLQVPPWGLKVLGLPLKGWKVDNQSQDGSSLNRRAYRIQSLQPIVAYQFNPLDNVNVYSNDASLLLPTNALGTTYRVLTFPGIGTAFRSYFTVVAVEPGVTQVAVTVSASTTPGAQLPALSAGQSHTFPLARGDVLNLEASEAWADLTGSLVEADRRVAVFAGSELSVAPMHGNCVEQGGKKFCAGSGEVVQRAPVACVKDSDCEAVCCGDHLEEQLFPAKAWGTTYVATAFARRGLEKDVWRVVALADNTTVTMAPNPLGKDLVLAAGEMVEVVAENAFIIDASKPVQVGQIMASSYNVPAKVVAPCIDDSDCADKADYLSVCAGSGDGAWCAPVGDPALLMVVATSQYLSEYVFLVPDKYARNYVTLIVEPGTALKLDGESPESAAFKQVAKSKWRVARLPVAPGTHRLVASKPVGLIVYGYDRDVSYGYAGGAGL